MSANGKVRVLLAASLIAAVSLTARVSLALPAGSAERGRALFAAAAGCSCHTPSEGPIGAGGGEIPTPFGTFYGTNITPDREFGIGDWSDDEIAAAIRDGVSRGKGVQTPAMPYYWYAAMSDGDVADLIAYLRTLPPVRKANRPHEKEVPFARLAYRAWRWWFAPKFTRYQQRPTDSLALGKYLVDHVSLCADCHTPRNRFGALRLDLYLAGTAEGPGGERVPNITPHPSSGIGEWDEEDLVNLLKTGFTPEFDNVQGSMAEVVEGRGGGPGYKDAPETFLRAIAQYLRTVPPIDHPVPKK